MSGTARPDGARPDGARPDDHGRRFWTWVWWRVYALVGGAVILWITFWAWTALPLWLVGAAVVSPWLPGRWRPLRLLCLLLLHLTLESLVLLSLLGLWIGSGFGWRIRSPFFQWCHYDAMKWYLGHVFAGATRVLNLSIRTVGPTPDAFPGDPLIVLSRHAGPGDSFIVVHALMNTYGREPRIVLKNTLAWEPTVGILMHRLPNRFVSPNPKPGHDLRAQISQLASGLDSDDALLIFPEGGNFTPARRERAIARLRGLGLDQMAEKAAEWTHVLAPRPGGVAAAFAAAPEADVLLCAHTGLDHLTTVADLWRWLPMDKQLTLRWWRVPRPEIPTSRDGVAAWLFTEWARIDRWIDENREQP